MKIRNIRYKTLRAAKACTLAVLIAATGVFGVGCTSEEQVLKELLDPSDSVEEVAYCEKGDIKKVKVMDAHVETEAEFLSFDIDGYIFEMYVQPGEKVGKGDVIASLTSADFEEIETLETEIEELKTANKKNFEYYEAEIELAKLSGENYREYEITYEKEKALAELKLKQKQDRYDKLKAEDIGYNYIEAPYDGYILAVSSASNGTYVTAGTPIAAESGKGAPFVTCEFMSEKTVKEYDSFYAIIHGKEYDLTYVPNTKDQLAALSSAGKRPVSIFTLNEDQIDESIQVGDYATVVTVMGQKEDVLIVPINSVYTDATGKFVYLVDGGKHVRRDVVTGLADNVNIEITEGLSGGECVYVKN